MPTPGVSHQIRSGTIRGGALHRELGDPQEWWVDYEYNPTRPHMRIAVLKGATPANTVRRHAIKAALKEVGFTHWGWVKANKRGVLVYREWKL